MKKVLVVDNTLEHVQLLESKFSDAQKKIQVLTASNGEEAVDILKTHSVATLVTDLYMPKMDGIELLEYMGQAYPKTPCIVLTKYNSPEIQSLLEPLDVFACFEKSCDLNDLAKAVNDALFHFEQVGGVDGLSIPGFLQLIEMEEKSCVLEARLTPQKMGRFYCIGGEIYDAECGELSGEEAALTMISYWENATLRLRSLPSTDVTWRIKRSLRSLTLEGIRLKGNRSADTRDAEEKSNTNSQPDDLLEQAVQKAESLEFKQAQALLANLLKQNTKNFKGWLWYSRVADSMKAVKAAIKNAHILAPDDLVVQLGRQQVEKALQSGCPAEGTVEHCPFCWTPINHLTETCSYCNAELIINDRLFSKTAAKRVNGEVLDEAFSRYVKITLLQRNNVKAHYNLCLACLNVGKYDLAIEHLYRIRKIDPTNDFYSEQLSILLDHLVSIESSTAASDEPENVDKRRAESSGSGQKTILVVEDSNTTRKVITLMLSREGFDVVQAKDGIECLAKFNEITPDLVLLDIIMPGMDGYQVLSTLKKNKTLKNIPVIMLTAKDSLIDKLKGKISGSDEYLTKPFSSEELMAKINKYLPVA